MASLTKIKGATHAYVATRACGCTVVARVDVPGFERDTERLLSEIVPPDCTVERVPIEDARTRLSMCEHRLTGAT